MLAACTARPPTTTQVEVSVLAERDFATSDLYFLEFEDRGRIHRINASDATTSRVEIESAPDSFAIALAAGPNHRGLYVGSANPTNDTGDIRRVDHGTHEILYSGEPVHCVTSGQDQDTPIGISRSAPNERHDGPVASTWVEVGVDAITDVRKFDPHVFCPVRGPLAGQWAVAEDVEMTEQWTTELVVTTDDNERKLRWTDCVLMPTDFTTDGARLAMGAICQDTSKSGLYVVDLPAMEATTNQPLVQGSIGAARWSPSDRLIAFAHQTVDEAGDPIGAPATVTVVRPSDGAIHVMPIANTSWPTWVLRDDANGASSRS